MELVWTSADSAFAVSARIVGGSVAPGASSARRWGSISVMAIWLTLSGVAAGRDAVAEPSKDAPHVLAEFPLADGDAPWIALVAIRYRQYQMLIDTGTGITTFHIEHRGVLGNAIGTINLNSSNGMKPVKGVERFQAPVLEIGSLKRRPRAGVLCMDLGFITEHSRTKVDGVLGMDLLRGLVLDVDRDARRLRFCDAADPNAGTPVPIIWADRKNPFGTPFAHGALSDGAPQRFSIDTGMNGDSGDGTHSGALNGKSYDELIRSGTLTPVPILGGATVLTLGGADVSNMCARTGLFSFGPFKHQRLIFCRSAGPSSLGRGFFSRYHATFDFVQDKIYLRPADGFHRDDFQDLSGMRIVKSPDDVVVASILKSGPAHSAGLAVNDVLLAIDGRSTSQLAETTVREMLSTPRRHVIDFRRRGVPMRVNLSLDAGVTRSTAAAGEHGPDCAGDRIPR